MTSSLRCCLVAATVRALAPPPGSLAPPPGPSLLRSFVGIGLDGSPWQFMLTLKREGYDGATRVPLGPAGDYYFLLSPESVKRVVLEDAESYPRRFSVPLFRALDLDRGIVYEQGERHRSQKRRCIPAFENSASMASFLAAFDEEAAALAAGWRAACDRDGGSTRLDLYAETRSLTLRVVLRVTFGLDARTSDYENAEELSTIIGDYLEAIVATANEIPPLWQVYPPLSANYVRVTETLLPRLRFLVNDLIAYRRRELDDDGAAARSSDLLSILARDATLEDADILYILFDLIIAGSDTTASTIAAALFILHEPRHAAALDRARAEAATLGDDLALDAVRDELPYHTGVAREVLRLFPPVPFIGRTSVRETDLGGAVPEGATMCWSPWFLGRDPAAWGSDAAEFRPARWLDDPVTGGAPTTFSWLPFGAGPRGCLGTRLGLTESIVGTARILRDFDLAFDRAGEELSFKYDLTLNLGASTTCTVSPRRRV